MIYLYWFFDSLKQKSHRAIVYINDNQIAWTTHIISAITVHKFIYI